MAEKSKRRLGRGMRALVDDLDLDAVDKTQIVSIPVDDIMPNRYQPRKSFNDEALHDLSESIREKGVIQPIIASELGDGRYELVAGERRWRASKLAGLTEIPAIIRDYTENERVEIALIENIQREDLNAIEVSIAYKELMERLELSQEELAHQIGKSRSSVANTLRLLKLPEFVRDMVVDGRLSEGHARAILVLDNLDAMIDFAKYIVENKLSVRAAEAEVKSFTKSEKNVSRETSPKKAGTMDDLEERFVQSLGVKVEIKGSQKKGRVQIFYNSIDELESIYKTIANKE